MNGFMLNTERGYQSHRLYEASFENHTWLPSILENIKTFSILTGHKVDTLTGYVKRLRDARHTYELCMKKKTSIISYH